MSVVSRRAKKQKDALLEPKKNTHTYTKLGIAGRQPGGHGQASGGWKAGRHASKQKVGSSRGSKHAVGGGKQAGRQSGWQTGAEDIKDTDICKQRSMGEDIKDTDFVIAHALTLLWLQNISTAMSTMSMFSRFGPSLARNPLLLVPSLACPRDVRHAAGAACWAGEQQ